MRFYTTYEWWNFCLRGVCFDQVIARNACVFADCNSVMQQMAAEAGDIARDWTGEQPCWTTRRRRRHIVHQKMEGRARSIRCGEHGRSSSRYVDDQTCWRDRATHWWRTSAVLWQSLCKRQYVVHVPLEACIRHTGGTPNTTYRVSTISYRWRVDRIKEWDAHWTALTTVSELHSEQCSIGLLCVQGVTKTCHNKNWYFSRTT